MLWDAGRRLGEPGTPQACIVLAWPACTGDDADRGTEGAAQRSCDELWLIVDRVASALVGLGVEARNN
jgi:hypothetical protein